MPFALQLVIALCDQTFHIVQAALTAEDTSLVRDLCQQLNKQKQELQDARAEVMHLRAEALQKSTASPLCLQCCSSNDNIISRGSSRCAAASLFWGWSNTI